MTDNEPPPVQSYRTPEICHLAGATYRQIDYWARIGLVTPSIHLGKGSGYQRAYSPGDAWLAIVCKNLLDSGLTLTAVREVLHEVATRGGVELPNGTVITIDRARLAARFEEPAPPLLQLVTT